MERNYLDSVGLLRISKFRDTRLESTGDEFNQGITNYKVDNGTNIYHYVDNYELLRAGIINLNERL